MEIEKKYMIKSIPEDLASYQCLEMQQAYLNREPVVRIRKEDDSYYLTYKGSGMMIREEYNLPLDEKSFFHLLKKADGNIISKKRYIIPIAGTGLRVELDIFCGDFDGLLMAEVEFASAEEAEAFEPPEWFGLEVTLDKRFHNSYMSGVSPEDYMKDVTKDIVKDVMKDIS